MNIEIKKLTPDLVEDCDTWQPDLSTHPSLVRLAQKPSDYCYVVPLA